MKIFLLGCLCGFVAAIIIIALYSIMVIGGDKNE